MAATSQLVSHTPQWLHFEASSRMRNRENRCMKHMRCPHGHRKHHHERNRKTQATRMTRGGKAEAGSSRAVNAKCTGDVTTMWETAVRKMAPRLNMRSLRLGTSSMTPARTK